MQTSILFVPAPSPPNLISASASGIGAGQGYRWFIAELSRQNQQMITLCSISVGANARLPCGVTSCKLWTMRGKARAKKKGTEAAVALGFGGSRKEQEKWRCANGCGACCKMDKGPAFPTPEEIFDDDPVNLQLYKSLIGADGWCIHYEHTTRTCSIYSDRPSFCRVKPEVFQKLYGIPERRFNKEACCSCKNTITAIYGASSEELKNFNRTIRSAK